MDRISGWGLRTRYDVYMDHDYFKNNYLASATDLVGAFGKQVSELVTATTGNPAVYDLINRGLNKARLMYNIRGEKLSQHNYDNSWARFHKLQIYE